MTRPVDELGELDLAALEGQLAAGPQQRAPGEATWRHIVDAAAPLFDERPLEQVKVVDIAAAAGVSPSTVYHQFRRPSAVAAAGWVRHLPDLQAVASRPLTGTEGPLRRSEEVMSRYIELGRTHRSALEALMIEAVAAWRGPDRDPVAQRVLRTVPISDLLVPHLRELRTRGRLRRRVSLQGLARTIVFLVSMRTLAMPDDPVEQIVDDSIGLVMEGALAAGAGGVRRPHRPVPAPGIE
jgi:AcrR family transcriptional regulator